MDIAFDHPQLQRLCCSAKKLQQALGEEAARDAAAQLASLRAAASLEDLRHLPGRCRELDDARSGQMAVTLAGDKLLIFAPEPPPRLRGAQLIWSEVTSIRILEVGSA